VPIISMLRWLADTEAPVDVCVLLSFRTSNDIIYRDELNLLSQRHSNIKIVTSLTNEPSCIRQWQGITGRINRNMIAALVPDLTGRSVYLCGPDTFMADCKYSLQLLKLPSEQLYHESFFVNGTVFPGNVPIQSQPQIPRPSPVRPSLNKPGSYQIRFARSEKGLFADGSRTFLELAEIAGVSIEHECLSGSCGQCIVKCIEGRTIMTEQAEIDRYDKDKGWVYACCAFPASNVVLDV